MIINVMRYPPLHQKGITMKQRISEILEPQSKDDFLSRSFNIFIISL